MIDTMKDELIERLKSGNPGIDSTYPQIMDEAAQRIEQLKQENETIREYWKGLIDSKNQATEAYFRMMRIAYGYENVLKKIIGKRESYWFINCENYSLKQIKVLAKAALDKAERE